MVNELKVAIEAAKKAGELALAYFDDLPEIIIKSNNTPVTKADKEVEEIIRQTILSYDPNAKCFGEELGGTLQDDVWIIDPIDGTKNFIRGVPLWSVLIAHCVEREIVTGVAYTPILNVLTTAQKGYGAYRESERMFVSKVKSIKDAFVSHPGNPTLFPNVPQVLELLSKSYYVRGYGDAYSYQLLASGKIDVHIETKVSIWDVAPFKVIIEEAGGRVTNLKGDPWTIEDKTIVASNGLVHDEVIRILNK